MQAALRGGHFSLAQARRELSRTRNSLTSTVSPAQFPQEFDALLTECDASDEDSPDGLRSLKAVLKGQGEPRTHDAADGADAPGNGGGSGTVAVDKSAQATGEAAGKASDSMEDVRAQLSRLGVAAELQGHILSSVADDGGGVGTMAGDRLVVESADGTTEQLQVRRHH